MHHLFFYKKLKCSEKKLGVVPFGAGVKRRDIGHAASTTCSLVCGMDLDLREV